MPLTAFQKEVLGVLMGNRSEASHFAGGLVLHAADDSARYSHDFDVFHEAVEDLGAASEKDVAALEAAGFDVEKLERDEEWSKPSSFRKARARRDGSSVELDWAHDSAFRFFPKEEWVAASDRAREEMTLLADERLDMPIGVAFVDKTGRPGWIRNDPSLQIHFPSLRGCWPVMRVPGEGERLPSEG